jgi:hypothetical protein
VADALELKQATSTSSSSSSSMLSKEAASLQQELEQAARQALSQYLLQARQQQGLEMGDALDTLLACLLCDVGDAAALERLVAQPGCLAARPAVAHMQASSRWHALALHRWAAGKPMGLRGHTWLASHALERALPRSCK